MHFTLGEYFELHFRQFYHGSILYGPWLACADPESYVRGGQTQLFFLLLFIWKGGERIQIPLKEGFIIGPLAKRHFKWRFAGGPMMARHVMLAWYMCSFEIFYGIWTSIA